MESLTQKLKAYAHANGCDLVGVAPVAAFKEIDFYSQWLAAGYAGEMEYLRRQLPKRLDPRQILPSAQSVVVIGVNYHTPHPLSLEIKDRNRGWISRYAWGDDYHRVLSDIGNVNLKPEIAHTASVGADWHDNERKEWNFKLTGYVTHVKQYIDAQRCTPGMNTQCTASNVTTTDRYVKLQYINQTARLYGLDLSAERLLGSIEGVGSFTGAAMFSYVRGKNRTTGDNLYHMMPRNTKLALVHRLGGWTNTAEVQYVDDKTYVSRVRNEVKTPDYTLLNLRSSYEWKNLRLDLALENAMNVMYYLPLGGAYVGQGNSMTINGIPWGMSVPGRARSLNVGLNISF